MLKIFMIMLFFLLTSCSTYTVTVLHNEVDPTTFIDPDTEMTRNDPSTPSKSLYRQCKPGFTIKTNKNKKECMHQ